MPTKPAITELDPEVKKIQEQRLAEAAATQARALKKPKGWLVRTPLYGTADAAKVPLDELAVHRHNVLDENGKTREVTGGYIQLVYGQGYIDNEDWANYVTQYWGPDGYKVTRVNADNSTTPMLVKMAELARIVDAAEVVEPAAV